MTAGIAPRRYLSGSSARGAVIAAFAMLMAGTSGCSFSLASRESGLAFGTTTYVVQTVSRDPITASQSESDSEEASNAMSAKVDYFLPARPSGLLAPARYPGTRIADGPESVTIAVILKISDRGDVISIDLDPLAYSTPVKGIVDFVAALRAVAPEWEFVPAAVMSTTTEPGSGGATTLEKRPVASELAVQFTFLRTVIR